MTTKLLVTIIITAIITILGLYFTIKNCKRNKPNRAKDLSTFGFILGAMLGFAFSFNIICFAIIGLMLALWIGSSIRIPSND